MYIQSISKDARRGGALLFTVFILAIVLLVIVGSATSRAVYQTQDRYRYELYKDEFAAAEEAANRVFAHCQFLFRYNFPDLENAILNSPQPTVSISWEDDEGNLIETPFTIGNYSVTKVSSQVEQEPGKAPKYVQRYDLTLSALKDNTRSDHVGVAISQQFVIEYNPLHLFAIFYDPILEFAPGPQMTVNGRVHSNSDMYLQSNNRLDIEDEVTAAQSIYHGRHPDSGKSDSNGSVNITDGSGLANMQGDPSEGSDGSGWLDSSDSSWGESASDRWNGHVRTQEHGTMPLDLPIPPVADPHVIIERAKATDDPDYDANLENQKFENQAGIRIYGDSSGAISGQDASGNTIHMRYYVDGSGDAVPLADGESAPDGFTEKAIAEQNSFYDFREDTWVSTIDVNIANMAEAGYAVPSNGILYVSNEDQGDNMGGVRLTNGEELPVAPGTTGFSVASDDPVYVQGDFNSVNETLAMVAGDAISIMSNNWDDDEASNSWSNRDATPTETNAVFMNGVVPSANGNYSGGVENYFRYMEDWSGEDHTVSGSIVNLWESQKATGRWSYGNPVYKAPGRNWSWDTNLGGMNGPPGSPYGARMVRQLWTISSVPDN